jgi:DNA-binding CsgD family transcriptional regulator
MPALTRDALLIAAVDSEDGLSEILAGASVLAGQPVTAEMLEPADNAQILRFDEMHVRFRHPLVRSGILHFESVPRRQAANVALSAVLTSQPYRRTWHLAQGTQAPNDAVADELEAHHLESIRRGSLDAAIAALERSAQLTTDPQKRARRLLLAAQHAFGMGRADLVDRLVTTAEEEKLSKRDRARVEWLREIFNDGAPGDANRILELCAIAEESAAEGDADLALELLLAAAMRCFWTESGPPPRARVVEVSESLDGLQDDPRCIAAIAIAEPILRGTRTVELLSNIGLESVTDANQLRLLGMAGRAVGAETHAADFLARAETKLRDQGRLGLLAHVLTLQSSVWIDLGDWARVLESMEEGQHLAQDTGQPIWSTGATSLAARVAGLTGDVDQALRDAAVVELASSARINNVLLADGQLARGFAWISAGRHADAYAALKPLFDPSDPRHHKREQFSGLMFLAEAAARSDQRDDARPVLERMEELATITTSPVLHMQLLYARAVLADPLEAEPLFKDGLGHDLTRWPWIRARLQLAYGSWLRRQRRVAESREHLRAAAVTLELIGARAWVNEATNELRAAGEVGETRSSTSVAASLSPQELQIARLAADGLSNREIGERLYLSPRTVGSHLYRIFPKLGVKSRAQLASRLVADPPQPEPGPVAEDGPSRVRRPERLAAVRATGLLDTPPEALFDTLTALAAELMDAPFAFVTIVDDARSFWKSAFGDVGGARENAVGDSFCQYVIDVDGPLLIGDTRDDGRTSSNPSIGSMGVVAWAGHPIRDPSGEVLGTFCVVDTRVREWTATHGRTLEAMASAVAAEIRLRGAAAAAEQAVARSAQLGRLAHRLSTSVTTADIGSAIAEFGGPLLGATTATLVLVEDEHQPARLYSSDTEVTAWADGASGMPQAIDTPATEATRTAAEVLISNQAELGERYPDLATIADMPSIRSVLCDPLIGQDGSVLGAISFSWAVDSGFETIDRGVLTAVLSLCTNTVERCRAPDRRTV